MPIVTPTPSASNYFKVGSRHENRKGPYEIVSIQGERMVVRWDSGEIAETDIKGQLKVIRNMEREFREKTAVKGRGKVPSTYGELFTGLRNEDFKWDVTGTHWRSRDQLGGAVAKGIETTVPMNSWSIYKRAQVHWADWRKYPKESAWLQAKFVVFLDESGLTAGFYVERSNKPEDSRADWDGFVSHLAAGGEAALREVMALRDLTLRDLFPPSDGRFDGAIRVNDGVWLRTLQDGSKDVLEQDLPAFLSNLPKDEWVDLFIGKHIPKEDAIALGIGIATALSTFFTDLVPFYEASIGHWTKHQ